MKILVTYDNRLYVTTQLIYIDLESVNYFRALGDGYSNYKNFYLMIGDERLFIKNEVYTSIDNKTISNNEINIEVLKEKLLFILKDAELKDKKLISLIIDNNFNIEQEEI